ncbi:putative zinc finger protein [Orchesella cincta]|uniref:Putative zinc finger protein n=1 Tax=Orchesella cincta TaxID=48709 RepID=A0A1D2MHD6_ORCCI|nr:putative zinc finger protein [Orchesella cincta]
MEQLMAHAMSSHNQPQHQFHPGQIVGPSSFAQGPPGMVLHQQALMGNPNMGMNQHPSVSLQIPDPNKLVKQEQNFGKMQQPQQQQQPPPPPVSSFSQDCQYPLMSPAPLAQNLTLKKEKSPLSSEGSSFDSEREDPWLNNGKSKSNKKKGKNSNQTRRASEPGGQNSSSSGSQKRRFSTSTTAIIQEKEKPFECTTCGRRFTQRIGMLQHQRRHTGERPFGCAFCDKRFTQKSGLVQHERLHTNEKPFNCSYCEKSFTQKSGLVQHERTHTGEKPYVCLVCSKAFTQLSGLKQHKKVHERSSETSASK